MILHSRAGELLRALEALLPIGERYTFDKYAGWELTVNPFRVKVVD